MAFSAEFFFSLVCALQISAQDVPEYAAESISFVDTDAEGSYLGGIVTIQAAEKEDAIDDYVVIFVEVPSKRVLGRLAVLPAAGPLVTLTYTIPYNTRTPTATGKDSMVHLQVNSRNANGELNGPSIELHDSAVPTLTAETLDFEDVDLGKGVIGGVVTILRARGDRALGNVESYVAYTAVASQVGAGSSIASVRAWRWVAKLGEVTVPPPTVTRREQEVCRCLALKKRAICQGATKDLGSGGTLSGEDCAKACEATIGCKHILLGRQGTQVAGRCLWVIDGCGPFDSSYPQYDTAEMSRGEVKIYGEGPVDDWCPCGNVSGVLERTLPDFPRELYINVTGSKWVLNASRLVVVTANEDGEMSEGRAVRRWVSLPLVDLSVQKSLIRQLTFEDHDPTRNFFLGNVLLTPSPQRAQDVWFALYLASGGYEMPLTARGEPLSEFRGSNGDFSHSFGFDCPQSATTSTPSSLPLQGTIDDCLNGSSIDCENATLGEEFDEFFNYSNDTTPPPVCSSPLPDWATHLLAHAKKNGSWAESRHLKLMDNTGSRPQSQARALRFKDVNSEHGVIEGVAELFVEAPEPRDIAGYRIYFEGEHGKRIKRVLRGVRTPWLAEVESTGFNLHLQIRPEIVPGGASRLIAVAVNKDGEAHKGVTAPIYDIGAGDTGFKLPVFELVVAGIVCIGASLCFCLISRLRRPKVDGVAQIDGVKVQYDIADAKDGTAKKIVRWKADIRRWSLKFKFFRKKETKSLELEEEAQERWEPAPLPPPVQEEVIVRTDPVAMFDLGEQMEYWSVQLGRFVLSSVEAIHEDDKTFDVRISAAFGGQYREKVDPKRLRRPLMAGESIETKQSAQSPWESATVEDGPRWNGSYAIRLLDGTPNESCPAHRIRRVFATADNVQVYSNKEWTTAVIVQVEPHERIGIPDDTPEEQQAIAAIKLQGPTGDGGVASSVSSANLAAADPASLQAQREAAEEVLHSQWLKVTLSEPPYPLFKVDSAIVRRPDIE